jgi:hypothetical protein
MVQFGGKLIQGSVSRILEIQDFQEFPFSSKKGGLGIWTLGRATSKAPTTKTTVQVRGLIGARFYLEPLWKPLSILRFSN